MEMKIYEIKLSYEPSFTPHTALIIAKDIEDALKLFRDKHEDALLDQDPKEIARCSEIIMK